MSVIRQRDKMRSTITIPSRMYTDTGIDDHIDDYDDNNNDGDDDNHDDDHDHDDHLRVIGKVVGRCEALR